MSWDKVDKKLDKIIDTQTELKVEQATMNGHWESNTKQLATHIKRTNKIEGKVQKMVYIWIAVIAAASVKWGAGILKFLGLLI